jgi:uncharacterized protein (TIGR00730 family)
MARKRYELKQPELNQAVEDLVERAQEIYGESDGAELVRQILVTGVRLLRDGAEPRDLKLLNSAMKELRHSLRVFRPYESRRKVAVFGSARTEPDSPDWEQARVFAERVVRAGWMVITGAGGGIMAAAQGGAGREDSFGVNIRLPFEQRANDVIDGDHKLINFRYFFTRKVTFVKEAHAIALFPGGFGTHDEAFEALTLMQTGKGEMLPVVFIDPPGGAYWREWREYVRLHMTSGGYIGPEDLDMFLVTDDLDEAVREVLGFYSNYHSSRYVGDRLVLRVHRAPNPEELDLLRTDFKDIVTRGTIEVSSSLEEEGDEAPQLERVVLRADRAARGRLRHLINRLNALVADEASEPGEASPHEVFAQDLPDAALEERDAED